MNLFRSKTARKVLMVSLLALFVVGFGITPVAAAEATKAGAAPLNPDFVEYLTDLKNGELQAAGHLSGRVPTPLDLSHTKRQSGLDTAQSSYPAYYDLRTLNKVTPVRDQASCGACWAFAALASLESCLLPGESNNFSEQDMISNHTFDWGVCEGGNFYIATAYVAGWKGPVKETDVPYQYSGVAAGNEALATKRVSNVIYLPSRQNALDNNWIKQCLMSYGAVDIAVYMETPSSYYNATHFSYYCPVNTRTNHDVTVVGWDDNFSASNFSVTPPGNGAFIIKNSWGTDNYGDDGYVYVSYYDVTLSEAACFAGAVPYNQYGTNYQYDTYGWISSWGFNHTVGWGGNIFQAVNNEPLQAVGFYAVDNNVKYQVYVYKGVTANNPTSGTLAGTASGMISMPGYNTAQLDMPVALNRGEAFSIVIRFETSGYGYPVPCEARIEGFNTNCTSNMGESFLSRDGVTWEDMAGIEANLNACIKGFTAYQGVNLGLYARKEIVRSWLVSRQLAYISIDMENTQNLPVDKVIIYRRNVANAAYSVWKEVTASEFENGNYTCTDSFLEEDKTYSYKAVAVNTAGNTCGVSDEKSL